MTVGIRRSGRWGIRRLLRWGAAALALLLVVPLLGAAIFLRGLYSGAIDDAAHTRHRDAVWLGHAWVDGRLDGTDLAVLAARIRESGVRDVYVHAGPLEEDGSLRTDRHPRAAWFLSELRAELPRIRVQAWLGGRLGDSPDGPLLDAAIREAVTASARRMRELGFDGVHLAVEGVPSESEEYLGLLEETGAALREDGGVLSVSAHPIDPLPGVRAATDRVSPRWWSRGFFGEVAARADQVALLSHDTPMPWDSLYGGYVARQTELALRAAPDTTELLVGLPFVHGRHLTGRAETVSAAVRGARLGLSREDPDRRRFGLALYVDYAATSSDWRTYQQEWVAGAPLPSPEVAP